MTPTSSSGGRARRPRLTQINVGVPVTLADRIDDTVDRRGATKAEVVRIALTLGLDAMEATDGQPPGQTKIGDPT